ncbi:MAG: VRR-NUC domain-containing protein, partial [Moraxellaceae bacterium]|nr:VRR-NUC domain-containing protein [Moraxellaceae bacterium]
DKRQADIDAALERLEATDYAQWLLERWRQKHGVQNHFVFWEWVNESLLDAALALIPRAHLRAIFLRMLSDLRANRSGFPDLIAFMPAEGRYELIEVKGPGDRVQDNQARWMDYFARHGIPCRVMHARWDDA